MRAPNRLHSFAAIAQGLSSRGWCVCDDWFRFQPELILQLRRELMVLDGGADLKMAAVGRGQGQVMAPQIRRDRIAWVEGSSQAQISLLAQLEALRSHLNQHLFLGLRHYETQFAVYHQGDFYRRHVDSFRGAATRLVSLVLYLNAGWQPADGGELRLYPAGDTGVGDTTIGDTIVGDTEETVLDIAPQGGRVVVFLSEDMPHEVLPVAATRYSIASWYRGDDGLDRPVRP